MKKIYIIIALVLLGFSQTVCAQNMYWIHPSSNIFGPESAVTVVHSNGYVYYFQTGKANSSSWGLSVAELDPYHLSSTGSSSAFDLYQNQVSYQFILQGGFEDFNGDFFLYGYDKSFNDCPAFCIVSGDLQTFHYFCLNATGNNNVSFTQGCWGKDYQHATFYILVRSDGRLCAIDPSNPTNPTNVEPDVNKRYTDILWDNLHDCFIAAGSNCNGATCSMAPFLQVFTYDLSTQVFFTEFSYNANITVNGLEEGKALHTIVDQENLILYQDLNYLDYDYIWLTKIKDYWSQPNYSLVQSKFFIIPVGKLHAIDMVYDKYHDRLNFLGELNICTELTTILAQVKAFTLSGMKIGQLDGGMTVSLCWDTLPASAIYPLSQYIYGSNLTMRNLAVNYNSPCVPVLISGTNGTTHSVLSEVGDISLSLCDKSLIPTEMFATPFLSNDNINPSYFSDNSQSFAIYQINETLSQYDICKDPYACSQQTKEDTLKSKDRDYSTALQMAILEDYGVFVCEGFEGDIQCALYDMAGKLIQQCITVNGKRNMLDNTTGIYLLRATDAIGNRVVKKVFIP